MRLIFETDARDDYFARRIEGGVFSLVWLDLLGNERRLSTVGPNLRRGSASVSVTLPDSVQVDDTMSLIARITDTRNKFENPIEVTIKPWAEHQEGSKKHKDRKSPTRTQGDDRERPRELATPKIDTVYRDRWEAVKFDEYTAMKLETEYDTVDNETTVFRVNMDNAPLLNEIKLRRLDDTSARKQFLYGNVLVGLSILLQDKNQELPTDTQIKVEDRIEITCQALAPLMLSITSLAQHGRPDRAATSAPTAEPSISLYGGPFEGPQPID